MSLLILSDPRLASAQPPVEVSGRICVVCVPGAALGFKRLILNVLGTKA